MVTVRNNVILDNLGHNFRENYGILEYVSPVKQGRSFSDYRPNKKFTELLRHPVIMNKLSNDISSVFNKICEPKHVENEFLHNKTFVEIKSLNVKTANVIFVDENFKSMCETIHCQCLSLTKNQISKIKKVSKQ